MAPNSIRRHTRNVDKTDAAQKDQAYRLLFNRKFNEEAQSWMQEQRASAYVKMVDGRDSQSTDEKQINPISYHPGEPGVGPDLLIQLAQQQWPVELVACADPDLLLQRAKALNLPLTLTEYSPNSINEEQPAGHLSVLPVHLVTPAKAGVLNVDNGQYVVETSKSM